MRYATILTLALIALTACGRRGARSSDFDSATAAGLAAGNAAAKAVAESKTPHLASLLTGHSLDRHNMIFGGTSQQFRTGDSVLIAVKGQYLPEDADVSARIRFKNTTLDSVGARAGAADSAGFTYVGLRFASGPKWAKGTYQAEVFLNGKFQMSQDFSYGQ